MIIDELMKEIYEYSPLSLNMASSEIIGVLDAHRDKTNHE